MEKRPAPRVEPFSDVNANYAYIYAASAASNRLTMSVHFHNSTLLAAAAGKPSEAAQLSLKARELHDESRAIMFPFRSAIGDRTTRERREWDDLIESRDVRFVVGIESIATCDSCREPGYQHITLPGGEWVCPNSRQYWYMAFRTITGCRLNNCRDCHRTFKKWYVNR